MMMKIIINIQQQIRPMLTTQWYAWMVQVLVHEHSALSTIRFMLFSVHIHWGLRYTSLATTSFQGVVRAVTFQYLLPLPTLAAIREVENHSLNERTTKRTDRAVYYSNGWTNTAGIPGSNLGRGTASRFQTPGYCLLYCNISLSLPLNALTSSLAIIIPYFVRSQLGKADKKKWNHWVTSTEWLIRCRCIFVS